MFIVAKCIVCNQLYMLIGGFLVVYSSVEVIVTTNNKSIIYQILNVYIILASKNTYYCKSKFYLNHKADINSYLQRGSNV